MKDKTSTKQETANRIKPVVKSSGERPYLIEIVTTEKRSYNPQYGDDRECKCGHPYYRHFDSYEDNYPCGCKYCQCHTFVEKKKRVSH